MDDSKNTCLIGVDGGGTACRVALVASGRRYDVTLGAANAATDREGAFATVRAGIDQLCGQAGIGPQMLAGARAHVALAGVMTKADAQAIADGLGLANVRVSDDRLSTVTGALGDGEGAVAGIGTGSFLALRNGVQTHFAGGWGLDLGDESSGAWLGRGLLSVTLHVVDGLATGTSLTKATLGRYGTSADIVSFAAAASPRDIAGLAPLITSAASEGDKVAVALMQAGADYILRGLTALGWVPGMPICLTGGLGPAYQPWLAPQLQACLRAPHGSALDGALQLAAEQGAIA